jgi:hypothetical protein
MAAFRGEPQQELETTAGPTAVCASPHPDLDAAKGSVPSSAEGWPRGSHDRVDLPADGGSQSVQLGPTDGDPSSDPGAGFGARVSAHAVGHDSRGVRALYREAQGVGAGLEVDTRIADLPAVLRFAFVDDRLARVTVDFTPKFDFNRMPASPSVLLAAFDRLDGLLAQKYGSMSADRSTGAGGSPRASSEDREAGVQRGDRWLSHDWEFSDTLIDLSFAGNPTVYALTVTYSSNQFAPALERKAQEDARREADLKGL